MNRVVDNVGPAFGRTIDPKPRSPGGRRDGGRLLFASYIRDMNNPSCKVSRGEEGKGWTVLRRPARTFLGGVFT